MCSELISTFSCAKAEEEWDVIRNLARKMHPMGFCLFSCCYFSSCNKSNSFLFFPCRSPEEGGGLGNTSGGSSHSIYSLDRASHANSESAEGPGKKPEKEPKSTAQRASEKGEVLSQFELNYGSECLTSFLWDNALWLTSRQIQTSVT